MHCLKPLACEGLSAGPGFLGSDQRQDSPYVELEHNLNEGHTLPMTSPTADSGRDNNLQDPGIRIGPSQYPIRFETQDGLLLHGALWLTEPRDTVVIHVHGKCGNHYENYFLWELAKHYAVMGISMLTFSSRGANIITEAYQQRKLTYIGGALEDPTTCLLDIEACVAAAEQLGFGKVFLQGHSFGCEKVLHYALATSPDLPLILLGPVNSREDLQRYYESQALPTYSSEPSDELSSNRVTVEWSTEGGSMFGSHCGGYNYPIPIAISSLKSLVESGMLSYFDQMVDANKVTVPNRTLIVHGSSDPYLTYSNHRGIQIWFETRFPNGRYLRIPGADHHFQPHPAQAAAKIASIVSSINLSKSSLLRTPCNYP